VGGCYEPITISGLVNRGAAANGDVPFYWVDPDGRPDWTDDTNPESYWFTVWFTGGKWCVYVVFFEEPVAVARWTHTSTAQTPPSSGWTLDYFIGTGDQWGTPTLSNGEICSSPTPTPGEPRFTTIVGTGDAGDGAFLDSGLQGGGGGSLDSGLQVEGVEPTMVGNRELTATYTVGEIVTGSCQLLDADGRAGPFGHTHVYLYSVDITTRPETIALISHWMATFNWPSLEYTFEIDTTELAPGYYDLHLAFPGSSETFRIELIP